MPATKMQPIENLHKWAKNKTIKKVDTSAANGIQIVFTDGSGLWIEGMNIVGGGLIGPISYEFDPTRPLGEQ